MFALQDTRGAVEIAFTDRHGGASVGPYASLNLAQSGGDDPRTVTENLANVADAFARGRKVSRSNSSIRSPRSSPDPAPGPPLDPPLSPPLGSPRPRMVATMSQVHGSDVAVVHPTDVEPRGAQKPPVADALVTKIPGVILVVRAADCLPVLLADVERGVIGSVHVGRPGLVAGVVTATIGRMRDLGARRVVAWLGPHVCGRCYEVPSAMREEVCAAVPQAYAETSWGTPAVDIGKGVRGQLDAERVAVVGASDRCTLEDQDLFSYRRQGAASGRLAGMVWVRP